MNPSDRDWDRKNLTGGLSPVILFCLDQVTVVMVQPQRGQSEPVPERQVVPQLEQVLAAVCADAAQPQPFTGATLPQA
jgi:hypothetical protein